MRTLVLGAGVSGRAAARLAVRLGHDVTLYDRDREAVTSTGLPVDRVWGEWRPDLVAGADLVVTSPGIPEGAEPIRTAVGSDVPLVSELEFAARHLDAPYVAVTGTNGKTTVAEASAAMLDAGGVRSCAAGNVGLALSDVALERWECVVVEASSFQLRFIDRFHPRAAAILNVAPDHLDWHHGLAGYTAAKARIHENLDGGDLLVFDADDPGAVGAVTGSGATLVPVSGHRRPEGGNGPDGDSLYVSGLVLPRPDLDPVWMVDVTVAATLARHGGATGDGIARTLEMFRPGDHRRTVVAEHLGVTWIDDSKATNPHAAVASAGTYPSVVLIAGGRNKGLDLSSLATAPTVRRIVAIGEAATEIAAAGGERVSVVEDLAAAVDRAAALAVPGDTVLLAPGCASFDMFSSYAARGEAFAAQVRKRVVGHGGD